jgi:hypothetical protein
MDVDIFGYMKKILAVLILLYTSLPARSIAQVDTIYTARLQEVEINERWKNDTARYRYNQLKHYVKTVMPYVNAATKLFLEIDAKLEEPGLSRSEKRKFINAREDAMRDQFEDKVKALNTTQGALLMKLIARQTGVNIYHILTEFKNPVTAVKWQAWARLNGANINRKYHPEEEAMLERIMEELGYPLPSSYAAANK